MQVENKKYYPQLDAIRGIAFLSVFIFHTLANFNTNYLLGKLVKFIVGNMYMGLDVFFVLSSFLLTFLGIKEYIKNGSFSIKNYFIRRVLRIWPLYYLIMFFSFVLLKWVKNYFLFQISLPDASWYLFFVANYYNKDHVFFLKILWTLSVEEQFYILWGICLFCFQKHLIKVMVVFTVISILYNFIGAYYKAPIYAHTLCYLLDMMVGAYAAYTLIFNGKILNLIAAIQKKGQIVFYSFLPILFIVYFFLNNLYGGSYNRVLEEIVRELFVLFIGLVILHQMLYERSKFSLSKNKFLTYTGKISFGLYCFHGIIITLIGLLLEKFNIQFPLVVKMLIILCFTYLISTVSYYYIEKPFLKLKDKVS